MMHSFDIDHACQYGLKEAVMISNIQFWIAKNKANQRHIYDGRTWMYNSVKAFSDLFPYFTGDQIRRTLDRLVQIQVLVKGNYNPNTYDRTQWYAFFDESIFVPCQVHLAKTTNGNGNFRKSTNRTDSKPDGKQQIGASASALASLIALGVEEQTAKDWLEIRKVKRLPLTQTALDGVVAEVEKAGMSLENVLKTCCTRGWGSFEAKWLDRRQENKGHNPDRRNNSQLGPAGQATAAAAQRWLESQNEQE